MPQVMALFSMIQQYMSMLPSALGTLGQLLVSQQRLEAFLASPEQPPTAQLKSPSDFPSPEWSRLGGSVSISGRMVWHWRSGCNQLHWR